MSNGSPFLFDKEKAVEVILYIANAAEIADLMHISKILYFADKDHLQEYARFICGDYYVAMDNGPVPSGTYDLLKDVRAGKINSQDIGFEVHGGHYIRPLREANLDLLSESDKETLDSAIALYGSMPFGQLKDIAHDAAWRATDPNRPISIESIAKTIKNTDEILEYLRS
jgi:uncharacterized phage-associated protein